MMFGGRGSMGGGGGGGMMRMRTFGRAVTKVGNGSATATGPHDQFPPSTTASSKSTPSNSSLSHIPKSSKTLTLSSAVSSSSHNKNPISGIPIWHHSSSDSSEDCDWVSVDGIEDVVGGHGFYGHCGLGSVPSENEVEDAVYALQHVFQPASHGQNVMDKYPYALDNEVHHSTVPCLVDQVSSSSDGSEKDWEEPSLFPYNSTMIQANGLDRVYYAFHLLQTEPSVQRMVKSLSTDKAVWDAVLSNEAVQELRESFSADDKHVLECPEEETSNSDSLITTNIVMKIFDIAKAKFMEVIEKITNIVNELFEPANHKTYADGDGPDPFNERLKTSFMLSIMVLLVVVVSRAQAKA